MSNIRPAPAIYTPEALLVTIQGIPFIPDYPPQRVEAPPFRRNDDAKHLRLIALALKEHNAWRS